MDEIVVRLARALASFARLKILSRLALGGEKSPSRLGDELHMSPPSLSGHLARLTGVGLIGRRRSGRWFYCRAESPYAPGTLSGSAAAWLRRVLSSPRRTLGDCGGDRFPAASAQEAETRVHELIFDAATAFTDLRRLQILSLLGTRGAATAEALSQELRMSESAVCRQTKKLLRRGYLLCEGQIRRRRAGAIEAAGRERGGREGAALPAGELGLVYRLASRFQTPIHAGLFTIAQSAKHQRGLHTS